MKTVAIINPAPGGQNYTSIRKAHEYISRGRTVMRDGELYFITGIRRSSAERRLLEAEAAGMVFWNGGNRNPCAMKRPGEVRS